MIRFRYLMSLLTFIVFASPSYAVSYSAYVTNVLDGDSFAIETPGSGPDTIIRFLGINTNEPGTCHATAASDRLKELIEFKTVTLTVSDLNITLGQDSLGRLRPARFVDIGSIDVGETMLAESLAIPYPIETDQSRNDKYLDAAVTAQQAGQIIWDNNACGNGPNQNFGITLQVSWDAAGDDNVNINGEWIDIINENATTLNLTGWQLRDPSTRFYSFPAGSSIPPNSTMRVFVGSGTDTSLEKYWGNLAPIYTNEIPQGTYLLDPDHDIRATFHYPCRINCNDDLIGNVEIVVNYDAVGDDEVYPNGEWVDLINNTSTPVNLYGYFLESFYHFETNHIIPANSTLRVRVGQGVDTTSELFAGRTGPLFTNEEGSIALRRSDNVLIDDATWSTSCQTNCNDDLIGDIEIVVNYDAVGDDEINPNGEWVDLINKTNNPVNLYGYFLESLYVFETNHIIPANSTLRIRVGQGIDTNSELFAGRTGPLFTNEEGSIALRRSNGIVIDEASWSTSCQTNCNDDLIDNVEIVVNYDAVGDDNNNPNGEWVDLINDTNSPVNLYGYFLESFYVFNTNHIIPANGILRVRVGQGVDTTSELFAGRDGPLFTNSGGSIALRRSNGIVIDEANWGSSCQTNCNDGLIGNVKIIVNYDAVGSDTSNPNGEWVDLKNNTNSPVNLYGYFLESFYVFDTTHIIPANGILRVRVGQGVNSNSELYAGRTGPLFSNSGGSMALKRSDGVLINETSWYPCQVNCNDDLIGSVEIDVNYDAVGDDNTNPNGEWVDLINNTSSPVNLYGYFLESFYVFNTNHIIPADGSLRVRVGQGVDTNSDLFAGRTGPKFTNSGGSLALKRSNGVLIDQAIWPEPETSDKICIPVLTPSNDKKTICI